MARTEFVQFLPGFEESFNAVRFRQRTLIYLTDTAHQRHKRLWLFVKTAQRSSDSDIYLCVFRGNHFFRLQFQRLRKLFAQLGQEGKRTA